MIIRACTPEDHKATRDLIIQAFSQEDEADLVEALRLDDDMALELVAEEKKRVVGHVALSKMSSPEGWLALAPLSTDPNHQGRGIGSALCQMALQYANAPVVVLGDNKFYGRNGFEFDRTDNLTSPFPIEHTGLFAPDLVEKCPSATLVYASAFAG